MASQTSAKLPKARGRGRILVIYCTALQASTLEAALTVLSALLTQTSQVCILFGRYLL